MFYTSKPHLSSFPDHDIVIVTISDAQDVSSYTVASTGQRELFYGFIKFVPVTKRVRETRETNLTTVQTHSSFSHEVDFPTAVWNIHRRLPVAN